VYILNTFLKNHAVEVAAASAGAITEGATIAAFYGNYYTAVTLIQFALQLFVVSRVFRWFGVRGAILVVPVVMAFGYGLIALVPVFALEAQEGRLFSPLAYTKTFAMVAAAILSVTVAPAPGVGVRG
jgi:ATP/ADP translocase